MMKSTLAKLMIALMTAAVTIAVIEMAVRWRASTELRTQDVSATQLLERLPHMRVAGRELSNQMLIQNTALFSGHPAAGSVTRAYIGTSRTKILRPQWMGEAGSVNASGNSYNEISYGVVLQAELLKRQFPNLDSLFVEASLLMRKPDRLVVEEDHRKYLPLLRELTHFRADLSAIPERSSAGSLADWDGPLQALEAGRQSWRKPLIVALRQDLRFVNLFDSAGGGGMPVSADPFLATLLANGERRSAPVDRSPYQKPVPEVTQENIKVQRLRNIPADYPWDGLFDVLSLWTRKNGVRLVLFQPPVRADLLQFQLKNGLEAHVRDLERVAKTYKVPFIDLNRLDLGYPQAVALFSDEDHLETCQGVVLLQTALWLGADIASKEGQLTPLVSLADSQRAGEAAGGRLCRP